MNPTSCGVWKTYRFGPFYFPCQSFLLYLICFTRPCTGHCISNRFIPMCTSIITYKRRQGKNKKEYHSVYGAYGAFLGMFLTLFFVFDISRGNDDAINVHPIEFFLGEYNHLWSWFLCCRGLGLRVHALGALVYLIISGLLAGWNHTRFDMVLSLFGLQIFDSKIHDVHHRIPQSNYGQYTVFWDAIFGTYRYV
jgi:hypothetical protein